MTREAGPAADLAPRQQRFVQEYLLDLNAKQSAIRAGYSPKTAEVQGSRLLSNAKVQRAIATRMAERSKRTEVDADRALLELARVGFSDLRRVFDSDGRLKPMSEWDEDTAAAISSVKVRTVKDGDEVTEVVEIRLWDKPSTLEKIGKHLGMFIADKTHEDDKSGGAITDLTDSELFERLAMLRAMRARDVTRRVGKNGCPVQRLTAPVPRV
jgi:phage terminase small subunit